MRLQILLLLSLFIGQVAFAQNSINWRETQAKITHIEKYRTKRYVNEKATVEYQVQGDTKVYKSTVMLDRIPYLGSMKSVGDVIEVSYNPAQPLMLKSDANVFINTYGLYILIAAGLGMFYFRMRKMKPKSAASNLNN